MGGSQARRHGSQAALLRSQPQHTLARPQDQSHFGSNAFGASALIRFSRRDAEDAKKSDTRTDAGSRTRSNNRKLAANGIDLFISSLRVVFSASSASLRLACRNA